MSHKARHEPHPSDVAIGQLRAHYLLGPITRHVWYHVHSSRDPDQLPKSAVLHIVGEYTIYYNDEIRLSAVQWLGAFSLATLVLAIGAPKRLPKPDPISDLAAQIAALHWWRQIKVGVLPEHIDLPEEVLAWGRLSLPDICARLRQDDTPAEILDGHWTLMRSAQPFMLAGTRKYYAGYHPADHESIFVQALVDNAKRALHLQHDSSQSQPHGDPNSNGARARRWLIAHYPLLGSLLTQFDLIEDGDVCERLDIDIAAIQVKADEIFLNPRRRLSLEECKFVLAHEVLHAGLCHGRRRQGRDAYLWNVACDFVINDWLVTMNLGVPPPGLLFDEELRGLAAEEIYLRLAADLRIRRKVSTLRGHKVDILEDQDGKYFTDREEFYKRALLQGLDYHQLSGRGLLPAGLIEAIRTLNQPAIPWQAKLAEWIQEHFPLPERHRSWVRPSRRQTATPDIPRPRFIEPEHEQATRTFGVIVDTSGSMERSDLGKALGAIVAYSQAQQVRQVRLVYCDAQPYDEGFVSIDALASRVRVRGRGGTVLQTAVDFLLRQKDFPKDAPLLVITDGECESDLQIPRDHAFLLSPGMRLPFATAKPVFCMA